MTQSEKQKWEKIRAKGRTHYIVFNGILRIGIFAGITFTLCIFTFGFTTGAFKMPVWASIATFVFLTLAFGIGFGALIWHIEEKAYQTTDDHVSGLQSIAKAELQKIARKVLQRHARRCLLLLPFFVFVFGGLKIMPQSSPCDAIFALSYIVILFIFLVYFYRLVFRGRNADCYEFGATCPKCNKPLFTKLGVGHREGRCPNCGYQLFDDATAK